MISAAWPTAPAVPTLEPRDVHVWRIPLDLPADTLAELAATLGSAEHIRAARFRFARDRDRYVAAHGQLRAVLARYLAREPRRLRFGAGAHGKPHLAVASGRPALRFNLAHSDDLALIAVAWRREVGVDLERQRADRVDLDVARRMFASEDVRGLEALPPPLQQRAFFALWTIREAYAKGTGRGIADERDGAAPGVWTVRQLPIDAGFAAALAVEGEAGTVRCWSVEGAPAAALAAG